MNRGFLYGDGFFETIRVHDGSVPLIDFHLNRIYEGLELYELNASFKIDEEFIRSICTSYKLENATVRINFFRDGQGRYIPEQNEVAFNHSATDTKLSFFVPTSLDIIKDLKQAPSDEGSMDYYPSPKPNHPLFTIKSLSSAYYALAGKYAMDKQCKYLTILNNEDEVCEELRANILYIKNGEVYTPRLDAGGVFGVTLRYLFANYGGDILEVKTTKEDLESADEVYLCKGSIGVIRIK